MASIVGVSDTTKFLLKLVCKDQRLTQVEWVERHLNEDHLKIRLAAGDLKGEVEQIAKKL